MITTRPEGYEDRKDKEMWYYQIITKDGECLESGAFRDKDEMRQYCERRMKKLNADNWWAEYKPEE